MNDDVTANSVRSEPRSRFDFSTPEIVVNDVFDRTASDIKTPSTRDVTMSSSANHIAAISPTDCRICRRVEERLKQQHHQAIEANPAQTIELIPLQDRTSLTSSFFQCSSHDAVSCDDSSCDAAQTLTTFC